MPVIREKRFLRVKLDMVGMCQLKCVMCHFAHPDFVANTTQMGRELLEKVGNDLFPRAHDVVLSSSAEPLLAKELPRALELCREHNVPNFHFSTNGIALSQRILDKIIEVQMPLLTISCDGGTKETFERVRTPAKWERLMAAFDLVKETRRRTGSKTPRLSVTAVLMRSNIREMPGLIRLMREKGVEDMNFVHMAVMGGLGVEDETLLNDPKLCNDLLGQMEATAREVGMNVCLPMRIPETLHGDADDAVTDSTRSDAGGGHALSAPDALAATSMDVADYLNKKNREFLLAAKQKDHHSRPCYFPWYYIHVNPDGTVFPCGSWFEFTTFGDFKTQDFRQIWTGKPYQELRQQLYDMKLRDVCANCSVANMGRPDVKASFSHRAKVRRAQSDAR